jgi:ABC-type multidrug transport system fused ATPase/permease subunit
VVCRLLQTLFEADSRRITYLEINGEQEERLVKTEAEHPNIVKEKTDRDLRRAVHLLVPYWLRLTLVLAISLLSTIVSLYLPLVSRDFVDHALLGGDLDVEVREVERLAALDPFIARLPDGYRTIVGERGMALSAGERQRLATARAFLRNRPC